jgi:hypothetical protein
MHIHGWDGRILNCEALTPDLNATSAPTAIPNVPNKPSGQALRPTSAPVPTKQMPHPRAPDPLSLSVPSLAATPPTASKASPRPTVVATQAHQNSPPPAPGPSKDAAMQASQTKLGLAPAPSTVATTKANRTKVPPAPAPREDARYKMQAGLKPTSARPIGKPSSALPMAAADAPVVAEPPVTGPSRSCQDGDCVLEFEQCAGDGFDEVVPCCPHPMGRMACILKDATHASCIRENYIADFHARLGWNGQEVVPCSVLPSSAPPRKSSSNPTSTKTLVHLADAPAPVAAHSAPTHPFPASHSVSKGTPSDQVPSYPMPHHESCSSTVCMGEFVQCGGQGIPQGLACCPNKNGKRYICTIRDATFAACLPESKVKAYQMAHGWDGRNLATCSKMPVGFPSQGGPPTRGSNQDHHSPLPAPKTNPSSPTISTKKASSSIEVAGTPAEAPIMLATAPTPEANAVEQVPRPQEASPNKPQLPSSAGPSATAANPHNHTHQKPSTHHRQPQLPSPAQSPPPAQHPQSASHRPTPSHGAPVIPSVPAISPAEEANAPSILHHSIVCGGKCIPLHQQCAGSGFASVAICCNNPDVACIERNATFAACIHPFEVPRLRHNGWTGIHLGCGQLNPSEGPSAAPTNVAEPLGAASFLDTTECCKPIEVLTQFIKRVQLG